jgi:Tol biopolymer transport system component
MEYVPGLPITEYCDKHKLTIRQRLELFIRVCEGVQHAHQKAIIHRDLKPSNILVSEAEGKPFPRIIDFGVSKAISQTLTAKTVYTRIGTLIGTVGYMSPEQANSDGEDIDMRTDVYSLGAVLYELLSGALPLDLRKAAYDEMIRRLREEDAPKPSTRIRAAGEESAAAARNRGGDPQAVARQLRGEPDAIALKALERDRARRYPSASELASDIERYLRHEPITAHAPSAPYRALLFLSAVAAIVIGILVVAFAWRERNRIPAQRNDLASSTLPGMRSVALLSLPGGIADVALSPDGKEIAFIWDQGKQTGDLYLGLIAGERRDEPPLRLTHSKGGSTCCTSWSPDGRELAYGVCNDQGGTVFVVPTLGGPSRKVADVACLFGQAGFPVWTADGKSLLLVDRCAPTGPNGIVRLSLATGEKECLDRPPAGDLGDWKLALSPDGETVAFIRTPTVGVGDLYTLRLSDGTLHRVTSEGRAIWELMWMPDGQHLVVSSTRIGLASTWRVSAAGGAMSKETVYPDVGSLSADGRRLVYVRDMDAPGTIWRADLTGAGGRLLRVTNLVSSGNWCASAQPSPDGQQMVFTCQFAGSGDWGGVEIWKSNADGSEPTQLTSLGGKAGTPRWSPDSRSIAFDYRPGSRSQIFMMDADGRNQRMLTSDAADNVVPSWSRDGKVVYFSSNRTGRYEIWKKELADGQEFQVTRHCGIGALEAYDKKTLYYALFDGAGVWSVPVAGGDEKRLTEAPRLGHWGDFAVTESGLYLMDGDHNPDPAIFFYDFLHRQLTPVLTLPDLHDSWDANLSCLRSGKFLLFGRATSASSITMVEYSK